MVDTIQQTGLLQFAHEPAGLALLFESTACPFLGRYTALFQGFVYVQRHGLEKVEGVSLYLDIVITRVLTPLE
jgi:hypothetical protein